MTNLAVVEKSSAVQVLPSDSGNEMAMMILQAASTPDFDVAKLEKLMDLQERETNRQAKIEFSKAFAEMQSEIETVSKTKKGHNTMYATLEDIVDTVKPVLQRFGFAVSFSIDTKQGVIVTCTLMHKLGHSIDTTITLNPDNSGSKNAVQAIGSAVSYGKRYTICSLLNIATRDDDDAQSCSVNAGKVITTSQVQTIENKLNQLSLERRAGFSSYIAKEYQAANVAEIPANKYNQVLAFVNKAVLKNANP